MKKVVVVTVIVVVAALVAWVVYGIFSDDSKDSMETGSRIGGRPDDTGGQGDLEKALASATVDVPELGVEVKLKDGEAEFEVPDTPVIGYAVLGDELKATYPVSPAAAEWVVTTLAVNSGGSGVFEYLVLFKVASSGDGELEHTSSVFIGDRVAVKSIELTEGGQSGGQRGDGLQVKVEYLDRGQDEAMSDVPTIPRTLTFAIENGKFVR